MRKPGGFAVESNLTATIAETHLTIVDNNFCMVFSLIEGAHFSALYTVFIKRNHFPTAGNRYPCDTAAVLHAKHAK